MMPFRSSSLASPVIDHVLPEPVCPYAKIVPLNPLNAASSIGCPTSRYTSSCRASLSYEKSNLNERYSVSSLLDDRSISSAPPEPIRTTSSSPSSRSRPFSGRLRTATMTDVAGASLSVIVAPQTKINENGQHDW